MEAGSRAGEKERYILVRCQGHEQSYDFTLSPTLRYLIQNGILTIYEAHNNNWREVMVFSAASGWVLEVSEREAFDATDQD